jgi:chemotaxis protein methyltransferase CheR
VPAPLYSLPAADFTRFRALVRDHSGIDIGETRRADLERAVQRALAASELPGPAALHAWMSQPSAGKELRDALILELAIGETHFFRNTPQFEALEKTVLPELIDRHRHARRLRLWSAGCATGEEPYSLAILLHRLIPDLESWDVLVLATDINRQALAKAQAGRYGDWSFREVPPFFQETYFARHGREFEIAPHIRRMVTFAPLNLVRDPYPSWTNHTADLDLILCRNVFIYFHEDTVRHVADRFHEALADGGWLGVGHAEYSQRTFGSFCVRNLPGAIMYQKSHPQHLPGSSQRQAGRANCGEAGQHPAQRNAPLRIVAAPDAPKDTGHTAVLEQSFGDSPCATGGPFSPTVKSGEEGGIPGALEQARSSASRGDIDNAERWLDIALAQEPLSAPAHYLRGLIYEEQGKLSAALAALRRSVYADPDFVIGHFALYGLLVRLRQDERAGKVLTTVAGLLSRRDATYQIPEGDGLTAGGLFEAIRQRL